MSAICNFYLIPFCPLLTKRDKKRGTLRPDATKCHLFLTISDRYECGRVLDGRGSSNGGSLEDWGCGLGRFASCSGRLFSNLLGLLLVAAEQGAANLLQSFESTGGLLDIG